MEDGKKGIAKGKFYFALGSLGERYLNFHFFTAQRHKEKVN